MVGYCWDKSLLAGKYLEDLWLDKIHIESYEDIPIIICHTSIAYRSWRSIYYTILEHVCHAPVQFSIFPDPPFSEILAFRFSKFQSSLEPSISELELNLVGALDAICQAHSSRMKMSHAWDKTVRKCCALVVFRPDRPLGCVRLCPVHGCTGPRENTWYCVHIHFGSRPYSSGCFSQGSSHAFIPSPHACHCAQHGSVNESCGLIHVRIPRVPRPVRAGQHIAKDFIGHCQASVARSSHARRYIFDGSGGEDYHQGSVWCSVWAHSAFRDYLCTIEQKCRRTWFSLGFVICLIVVAAPALPRAPQFQGT